MQPLPTNADPGAGAVRATGQLSKPVPLQPLQMWLGSKSGGSVMFAVSFEQGGGGVFAGTMKFCLVDFISISKITLK